VTTEGMRSDPRIFRNLLSAGAVAVVVLLGVIVFLPAATLAQGGADPAASPAGNCSGAQASFGIAAQLTWNGVNVCSATNRSSALSVDFTSSASLVYNWNSTGGTLPTPLNLTDARLQMFYFGFAVSTRDVVKSGTTPATTGTFDMNWNPGELTYVLAGLYKLTASLLAPNGTTVWSESFFVKATAPYGFLAALPIILILIAIYELYSVARSGRQAALGGKGKPPESPPPESPPPEGATSEPPTAPTSTETPPPSEGSAPEGPA